MSKHITKYDACGSIRLFRTNDWETILERFTNITWHQWSEFGEKKRTTGAPENAKYDMQAVEAPSATEYTGSN